MCGEGQLKRERSRWIRSILRHNGDGEAVLDGLGVGMGFSEFLGSTFQVRTCLFDILLELLVIPVQLLVEVEVRILDLGVLLPRVSSFTASSTCGRNALIISSLSFALSCAANIWSMTSKLILLIFLKVLCLALVGTAVHCAHKLPKLSRVNKKNHRTSVFGNPMQKYCFSGT